MNALKSFRIMLSLLFFAIISAGVYSQGAPPPPPPPPPPAPSGVPLDGGVLLLILSGIAYGLKTLYKKTDN